jgi:hypothetical protein
MFSKGKTPLSGDFWVENALIDVYLLKLSLAELSQFHGVPVITSDSDHVNFLFSLSQHIKVTN